MYACADLLMEHSPNHPSRNSEIRVWIGNDGPVVAFGGNPHAGFDIHLSTNENLWCQITYQFAHELCHVLAQYQPHQHVNQWFEEVLCETASIYCLDRIALACANGNPPHPWLNTFQPGGAPYFVAVRDYVANLMNDPARQLMGAIPEWVQKHEPELRINPYLRDRTNIASNFLVTRVLQTPPILATIESLNVSPCPAGQDSLPEYFQRWKNSTPEPSRAHVVDLIEFFVPSVGTPGEARA